jgi:hypothetical protein
MILQVLQDEQRPTTARQKQRDEGAAPVESLLQRARRVAAALSAQELAVPWPEHAGEIDV